MTCENLARINCVGIRTRILVNPGLNEMHGVAGATTGYWFASRSVSVHAAHSSRQGGSIRGALILTPLVVQHPEIDDEGDDDQHHHEGDGEDEDEGAPVVL
jgi:hypothetical protein